MLSVFGLQATVESNKGWQDEQFKNMLKLVLKAASGLLKCTFSIFVGFISFEMTFAPFLNAPENVKWCNHKRMTNITYFITYSVFKWTYTNNDFI